MYNHRGEILRKRVDESGISKSSLAKKLNIARATLYNKFEEHNLEWELIIEIGKIIKYDFGKDFTELSNTNLFKEDLEAYSLKKELQTCKEELDHWRKKAFEYIEKYNKLLEKHSNDSKK